jgi:hypothetical protein
MKHENRTASLKGDLTPNFKTAQDPAAAKPQAAAREVSPSLYQGMMLRHQ